jgi:formiminotetrahydrofolate cyclodeaminase
LDCIEKDAEAFKPLAEAYSLPKDSEGYAKKLEECLHQASEPPLLILRYCTRIIELDERLASIGSKLAVSDAATSVMLAHGTMYGAYINVLVNTELMKDREFASQRELEAKAPLEEYAPRALRTFEEIRRRLSNG